MKLENQVTSLELSKKLKSLNFEQESLFYWITDSHPYGSTFVEDIGTASLSQSKEGDNYYSAYTLAELGEFLKKVNFEKSKIKTLPEEFCPRTEDESLKATFDQNFWAKMLICFKEEEWKEEFNKKYLNQLIPETNEIGNYWSLKVDYYNDFLPFVIAQIQAAEKRGKREGLMIVRHILEKGGNALDLVVEISEKVDQSIAN